MAAKGYKGNPNKGIWENGRFNKGMRFTDEPMREGTVKVMSNFDPSRTGGSLRPRMPYFNSAFTEDGSAPFGLGRHSIQFQPYQDSAKDYIVNIGSYRLTDHTVILGTMLDVNFQVIDGDTIEANGIRYRLIGIDAPEMSNSPYGQQSKDYLLNFINGNISYANQSLFNVKVTYDRYTHNTIDAFQRPLVWVELEYGSTSYNLNREMLRSGWAGLYGQFNDEDRIILPMYSYVTDEDMLDDITIAISNQSGIFNPLGLNLNQKPISSKVVPPALVVYSKPASTQFQAYQTSELYLKTPVVELDSIIRVDMNQINTDLDLPITAPIGIELLSTVFNKDLGTHIFSDTHMPYIKAAYSELDGIIFLGKVTYSGAEVYRGMISINYFVPLDDEFEMYPQYDRAYIKVETYKKNVFEIKFEDMDSFSTNLLDSTPNEIVSYIGQDALDNEYSYSKLRGVVIKNTQGKIVTNVRRNHVYSIEPIVAMPPLEDTMDDYGGYAIRFDIFNVLRNATNNNEPAAISTSWIKYDPNALIDPYQKWVFVAYEKNIDGIRSTKAFEFDALPDTSKTIKYFTTVDKCYINDVDSTGTYGTQAACTAAGGVWFDGTEFNGIDLDSVYANDIDQKYIPDNYRTGYMIKLVQKNASPEYISAGYDTYYYVNHTYATRLSTDSMLFKGSGSGIKVKVYFAPVRKVLNSGDPVFAAFESGIYPRSSRSLDAVADIYDTSTFIYGNEERELVLYNHGQRLYDCTSISYFNNRIVLYGDPKARNTLYLSDVNNPTYFPLKYALDQFDAPIVHVQPYGENLLVFTVSDIYIVFNQPVELEFGGLEDMYYSKKIVTNMTIEGFAKDSVVSIGKYIMFLSGSNIYVVKPNIYVEDPTDLFVTPLADPISQLLNNPTNFIVRRHQFYGATSNIFSSDFKPTVELKAYAVNNTLSLFMSSYIPELDLIDDSLFMIEIQYDMDMGTWKLYDTKSCAFPGDMDVFDNIEGPHYMMRNHPTINNGGTLMAKSGLNLWEFDEGYGRIFDIKPMKFTSGMAVYNTALITDTDDIRSRVKYPIYPYINSGNMFISPHLNKRFHQIHLDVTNIDCLSLPVSVDFGVDGHMRQNSRSATITQVINSGVGVVTEYHNTEMSEGLSFDTWGLDVSRFGPLQMLRVKFGVSGRGRIATTEIGFKTTGMFELYKYSIVYKEQSVR